MLRVNVDKQFKFLFQIFHTTDLDQQMKIVNNLNKKKKNMRNISMPWINFFSLMFKKTSRSNVWQVFYVSYIPTGNKRLDRTKNWKIYERKYLNRQ